MSTIRRIAILTHAWARGAQSIPYIVWLLQREWESQGIEVEVLRGVGRATDADIVFPQVDLSVLPDDYVRYLDGFGRVINRRVTDIRKSTFATHRLRSGDAWGGRVIVKTDCNYGGKPERRTVSVVHGRLRSWGRSLRRRVGRSRDPGLGSTQTLDPHNYPIFESLADVPSAVFDNPSLHVERFLEEATEEGYVLRSYNFCGDRWFTRRRVSADPIVRAWNSRLIDSPPVPPELVELRKQLGFDFGKFDFVICDGRPVVLDINTTPTIVVGDSHDELIENLKDLAHGIHGCAGDGTYPWADPPANPSAPGT